MGIVSWLGIGKEITQPVDAIGNAFDKIFTSDEERLTKAEMMEKVKQNPTMWQAALDKMNAASSIPFVAMARPTCVYVAAANAFQLGVAVVWFNKHDIPEWYITMTTTGFLGALGVYGILRTSERIMGKIK